MIKTLNAKKENALLESPTGSGKSLSILCGALAWLEHQKTMRRCEAEKALDEEERIFQSESIRYHDLSDMNDDEDEDDFIPLRSDPEKAKKIEGDKEVSSIVRLSLPKIYICSRTHRQIAQLVKELGRTQYEPKFVVLGSRHHYCINEKEKKKPDLNDACREATRTGTCSVFLNISKTAKKRKHNETPDCDIEDLVKRGRKERICPYYISRAAMEHCDIIFAPYNYLIDPLIREAMGINLRDDIVIIDEAHNIEDVCREAGSVEVTDEQLSVIQNELQTIVKNLRALGDPPSSIILSHECQGHLISILSNWLRYSSSERGSERRDFESSIHVWQDKEIVEELKSLGIVYEQVINWQRELQRIIDKSQEAIDHRGNREQALVEKTHLLSMGSCQILKGIYYSLSNLLRDNTRHLSSFRLVKYQTVKSDPTRGRYVLFTLGFWCLNPEVVFSQLIEKTKSVILTSGTLSPMDTFSSELACRFEQRLEALHIIDETQTWVGCVPVGPAGSTFLGNFKNMESLPFQDDLCRSLLYISQIVPGGILVFVPSYGFLAKLTQRMKNIELYEKINQRKKIFIEPRQGTPKDFERLLKNYYKTIHDHPGSLGIVGISETMTGAILFAVYRGKISEGLDLKDDNCRAVVSIGIPYPAFKDPKIVLKREFNDKEGVGRRLLPGQKWYEIQAFRALNQALGRCIRHRKDWGAIILLDQRFEAHRNVTQLSKWVRSRVRTINTFEPAMASLQQFVMMNMEMSRGREESTLENEPLECNVIDTSSEACRDEGLAMEKKRKYSVLLQSDPVDRLN